ncbi:MAG: c-type cytochrome [Flavobacteriaceae bacterium]|nr:c-type cytochrome [Flavobacteriaceae bacterium]
MSNDNHNDNHNDKVHVFEDEKKILLDHNYDGIRELDHPLPRWWVVTFWVTIIFSVPYYMAHTFFGAESIKEELASDMKEISQLKQSTGGGDGFDLEEYNAYVATLGENKSGKKVYKRKCAACHGVAGEGGVGPNLADNFWMHGNGSEATIFETINNGIPDKGMEAWATKLSKEKRYAVLKVLMDFKGTNPEGAKAPQGSEFK